MAGDWNVGTAVHEYGGAAAIVYDGVVYFSNLKGGRVYRVRSGMQPEGVTEGMFQRDHWQTFILSADSRRSTLTREHRPSIRKFHSAYQKA